MKISDTETISGHTTLGFGKAHLGETYKDFHQKFPQWVHWAITTVEKSEEVSRPLKHVVSYFKEANKCQDYYGPVEQKPETASASTASSNSQTPAVVARTNAEYQEMVQDAYKPSLAAGRKKKPDRGQKANAPQAWDIASDPDISDMSDV